MIDPALDCPECGLPLDGAFGDHEEGHQWWLYWKSLTPEEQNEELKMAIRYTDHVAREEGRR